MEERAARKSRRLKIILGFVMFFSVLFERFMWGEDIVPIWEILFRVSAGEWVEQNPFLIVQMLILCLIVIVNTVYLSRSIWLLHHKELKWFTILPGVGFACYAICLFATQVFAIFNIGIVIVDYMWGRWIEERDAINAAYEEQKALDDAVKERKKRVQYFPGKYPKEFFQMIRKNYSYGKKIQVILGAGCFLTAACTYIMLTVYGMITQIHGNEDFLSNNGLVQIFRQTGFLMAVFTVLMMYMIIAFYIKDQRRMNRLFVILGMRKRTVYLMFAVVFGMNVAAGGILGMFGGGGIAYVLREILQSSLWRMGADMTLASAISVKTLCISLLGYLVLVFLALGFNQENVINLARSMDMNSEVKRERRIRKRPLVLAIVGTLLFLFAIKTCFIRGWAEDMVVHLFTVLGILLLLMGGIALYMKRLETNRDKYHRSIIANRPVYYHYWQSLWSLFYLTIIHLFVFAVFAVQFTGSTMKQEVQKMYPYPIVGTFYDTEIEKLTGMTEQYGGELYVYPMFRMTSVYGTDALAQWPGFRPIQWPQGQHIAISESTYRALKSAVGENAHELNLTGNEMHVVYQQDLSVKAHTIDWDSSRVEKRLRIGQPLTYYNPHDIDNVFPVWQIKSEERDILIGTFYQGMQDNLIVFNDKYFQEQYDRISTFNANQWAMRETASFQEWREYSAMNPSNMTEGPTQLVCMNVPEKEYDSLLKEMQYFEDENKFDRMWDDTIHQFYGKQEFITNAQTEIFFRGLVYLFILIMLTVMGFFQYYVKFESETRQLMWQNQFLNKLGMREKDRKKGIAGQLKLFVILPLVLGGAGGLIFAALAVKARLYNGHEILSFALGYGAVYLVYIGIWVLWYFKMKKSIWRQAEWKK